MSRVLAVLLLAVFTSQNRGQEPDLIPLHPPKPVIVETQVEYYRTSMYDRWQYYGVDRNGFFRPRVVLDFPAPWYLVDGRMYGMLSIRPRDYIPHMID